MMLNLSPIVDNTFKNIECISWCKAQLENCRLTLNNELVVLLGITAFALLISNLILDTKLEDKYRKIGMACQQLAIYVLIGSFIYMYIHR
jgi:hypothetical protein